MSRCAVVAMHSLPHPAHLTSCPSHLSSLTITYPSCEFRRRHLRVFSPSSEPTFRACNATLSTQGCDKTWQLRAVKTGVLTVKPSSLTVTTNWKDLDIEEVRSLLAATDQNCENFSKLNSDGSLLKVDRVKLQRALKHSFVVVAIRMGGELEEDYYMDRPCEENARPWMPRRSLVAFGRATSDSTLTASIYDLAVAPSLQRQGIGRRLVQRIVREIARHGIADIAVMAGPENRAFFRACGFGSDILGSTAMIYTAESSSDALRIPPPLGESWAVREAEEQPFQDHAG